MGTSMGSDARHVGALARPALRRGENKVSREGDRVSAGDGRSWPIRQALSEVWRKHSADSLCGQRNQLLRAMPDRRKSPRGSKFVEAVGTGLAAHARGTRSSQAAVG